MALSAEASEIAVGVPPPASLASRIGNHRQSGLIAYASRATLVRAFVSFQAFGRPYRRAFDVISARLRARQLKIMASYHYQNVTDHRQRGYSRFKGITAMWCAHVRTRRHSDRAQGRDILGRGQ